MFFLDVLILFEKEKWPGTIKDKCLRNSVGQTS